MLKIGKKNVEIKGWISSSSLILVNMIHLPIVHACTKFQSSWPHSSWEKCDEIFLCWKLERKKNKEMTKQQQPDSCMHDTSAHCPRGFNLLGLTVPEESVTKNFYVKNWRERKWKNKGTNKQQQPDSSIHDISAHCPCVYQVSIF